MFSTSHEWKLIECKVQFRFRTCSFGEKSGSWETNLWRDYERCWVHDASVKRLCWMGCQVHDDARSHCSPSLVYDTSVAFNLVCLKTLWLVALVRPFLFTWLQSQGGAILAFCLDNFHNFKLLLPQPKRHSSASVFLNCMHSLTHFNEHSDSAALPKKCFVFYQSFYGVIK